MSHSRCSARSGYSDVVFESRPARPGRPLGGLTPLTGVLFPPALLAAALALLPLVYLVFRAGEGGVDPVVDELTRPQTMTLVRRSASMTAAATCGAVLIGVACALLVATTDLPFRRFWEVVLGLPLAVPTYVAAYTWLGTFSEPPPFVGALGVLIFCCYPYVYLPVLAAVRRLDPLQAEVGRSLGSTRFDVLRRITIPQLRPAATSGALLVALYVLSDFGAVSLMRYDTLTQGIYLSYVGSFDRTPAAILGVLLVVITAVLVALEARARGAAATMVATARTGLRPTTPIELKRGKLPALLFVGSTTAVALGIPGMALARWMIASDSFDRSGLGRAAWSSLAAAGAGALACTVLALPVAILAVRHPSRTTRSLETSTYLGHSLPGIVIALSMVFIGVRFLTPIYQRLPLLTIAYVVLFLPLSVAAVRSSIVQAPPALEEASRSLGSGPLATLRRVTLPVAAPGIAAGAALVCLAGLKELPATLLLRPTGFDTLATRIWTDTSVADYGRAAPAAFLIVSLGGLSVAAINRIDRLHRSEGREQVR
jgi:iron(III) transport system permease protein